MNKMKRHRRKEQLGLLLCLVATPLLSTAALAQAQSGPVVDAAPAPKPLSPLAPTPPAPAKGVAPAIIRAYGIAWASAFAGQAVQSYGNANSSAPTSAVNPALYPHPHDGTLSLQTQQTRVGMVVGEGSPVRATIEVDFVHFDQSSPVQLAYPRIRIGLLEWQFSKSMKVFAGQTWDLFGNGSGPALLPHSFNLVGALFQSGNIGFMRQQMGWSGRFGELEFALAIGMAGANNGPVYSDLEKSGAPTGSGRVMYHLPDKHGVIGVSGIGTSLRFSKGAAIDHRNAGGAQLFGDLTFGGLNIHAEAYVTQNMANTGALNLAQGWFGHDVKDAGGYVSGKYTYGEHTVSAMYGAAVVLNPSDLQPGYTVTALAPAGTLGTLAAGQGPGMKHNMSAHVGYWYSPLKGLSIVCEPYVYETRFKQVTQDVGRVKDRDTAWGGMLGSMYVF